jgi:hypothetical protein
MKLMCSSEFGEEKYIEAFLKDIPKTNYFLEIGAGDGCYHSHTRYFLDNGYQGLQIDKDNKGNDEVKQHFIFNENVIPLLKTYKCPKAFDFLTIDIMVNEYWILDKILTEYNPNLIVSRFNPYIHQQHKWNSITINYDPEFEYAGDNYFSYTLDAGKVLAEKYGYTIVFQNDEKYLYFLKNEFVIEKPDVNYIHKTNIRLAHKTNWITC